MFIYVKINKNIIFIIYKIMDWEKANLSIDSSIDTTFKVKRVKEVYAKNA